MKIHTYLADTGFNRDGKYNYTIDNNGEIIRISFSTDELKDFGKIKELLDKIFYIGCDLINEN